MALLTFTEAAQVATKSLRRPISPQRIRAWADRGLFSSVTYSAGTPYIHERVLATHLETLAPAMRMLTVVEAAELAEKLTGVPTPRETIRQWCKVGYLSEDRRTRRVLKSVRPGQGKRTLIDPVDLRTYVAHVVPKPSDCPVGRPRGKRAHA